MKEKMEIAIRKAQLDDSQPIAQLADQLGYKSSNDEMHLRLARILDHPDHCVYVAATSDEIVGWIHGFCSMRITADSFVEIGGLAVHEASRRNGIGQELVERVIAWVHFENCAKVRVRCNMNRKESKHFYEGIGFLATKKQHVLEKQLMRSLANI